MSATLWINESKGQCINLGGSLPLYAAFAELARLAGDDWWQDYPFLSGIVTAVEEQRDVGDEWFQSLSIEAAMFLNNHRDKLSVEAKQLLSTLIKGK